MKKNELRRFLKIQRKKLNPKERLLKQLNIQQNLNVYLQSKFEKDQEIKIAGYYPIQHEVDCIGIMKNLQSNYLNACFSIPKTLNIEKREMKFSKFDFDESKLKKGQFGYQLDDQSYLEDLDIILTPLVGFDIRLNRIGYGKGFYDTFFRLQQKPMFKIGLAFECQKITQDTSFFEQEQYNIKLNAIITEKRVYENTQKNQQLIQGIIQLIQQ